VHTPIDRLLQGPRVPARGPALFRDEERPTTDGIVSLVALSQSRHWRQGARPRRTVSRRRGAIQSRPCARARTAADRRRSARRARRCRAARGKQHGSRHMHPAAGIDCALNRNGFQTVELHSKVGSLRDVDRERFARLKGAQALGALLLQQFAKGP
jgi:hypothetical protein